MSPAPFDREDPAAMRERLTGWAGHPVRDVRRMPGHSGISYGFTLATGEELIIRVPPWGVRHEGVTDVLRQVPLLEVLADHGVPVPRVYASGDDERWFATPYLVVEKVGGAMPGDMFAGEPAAPTRDERDALFAEAMTVLARIHTVDVTRLPAGWSQPTDLAELVDHWFALLERSEWPALVPVGRTLRDRLRAAVPRGLGTGLVHGDYYQNNWMVTGTRSAAEPDHRHRTRSAAEPDHRHRTRSAAEPDRRHRGRLTSVLDWESAHLAPTPIDVGYIAMMYDAPSWDPALRPDLVDPGRPEHLVEAYARAADREPVAPTWFRALAGLRLGALTAYFLRLHRTGRRPDATWETIARSAPPLLERAADLARSRH